MKRTARSGLWPLRPTRARDPSGRCPEEGGFWAEVPALPGCASQGETMDELLANMREAIQAWLDTE